jgi:hypothetical protein
VRVVVFVAVQIFRGRDMTGPHGQHIQRRRHRRIEAVPLSLRHTVGEYESHLLNCRARARRAGTLPRSDPTIESALSTIRDLAVFINTVRNKMDWATIDVSDIEAFLATSPKNQPRNLTVLHQFFRFARRRHAILIDPTAGLKRQQAKGFRGRTLTRHQQRELFRRWVTDSDVHPHEALVGLLALLHGASSQESASCAATTSTPMCAQSGSAPDHTPCRSTPPAGQRYIAA